MVSTEQDGLLVFRQFKTGAVMLNCPIHGFAPTCIFSPDLLEVQADGTLPDIIAIEVKDHPEEEAFFRLNVSPTEAKKLPVVNGCIPFDFDAAEVMDKLPVMCDFCLKERRQALDAQLKGKV